MEVNKIICGIAFCALACAGNAQVAIGKEVVDGESTILDFDDSANNARGLILPAVESVSAVLSEENNGTFVFDKTDKTVKVYQNNQWSLLSDEGSLIGLVVNTSDENTSDQGVIIGSDSSNAEGVLVLESADKAMILPRIANPHTTVKSPYAGMMCYDTVSKSLAVFDGSVWNYWK